MAEKKLQSRAPIVTILGHVDHGKSSILEAIKDLKITAKESGGITQHIGAYEVDHQGKNITFIDTPGHEAFSAMRSRGAQVADIVVLVLAADEEIKPQAKEAIDHIKKAQIPMVVAINKMDKPGADPEKVKRGLMKEDVLAESVGGKIPSVNISAKNKEGIEELLEVILLVSEMEDLASDSSKPAYGVIIESRLDPTRGPTATVLVKEGILKKGDIIGTSTTVGKVRTLENFQGKNIEKAVPSMPAFVVGWEENPFVGDKVRVFSSLEDAKGEIKEKASLNPEKIEIKEGQKVLNIILKADVLGSLEALSEVIKEIPQEKAAIRILREQVGEINENDVKLAKSGNAIIVGFRVKANQTARAAAQRDKVQIKLFEVIYELAQYLRGVLKFLLEAEIVRKDLGEAEVIAVFRTEKSRQIIGAKITEGVIRKGVKAEVFRNEDRLGEGKIIELRKEQKNTEEMKKGAKCGILFEGSVKMEEGDIIKAYIKEKQEVNL